MVSFSLAQRGYVRFIRLAHSRAGGERSVGIWRNPSRLLPIGIPPHGSLAIGGEAHVTGLGMGFRLATSIIRAGKSGTISPGPGLVQTGGVDACGGDRNSLSFEIRSDLVENRLYLILST